MALGGRLHAGTQGPLEGQQPDEKGQVGVRGSPPQTTALWPQTLRDPECICSPNLVQAWQTLRRVLGSNCVRLHEPVSLWQVLGSALFGKWGRREGSEQAWLFPHTHVVGRVWAVVYEFLF